MNVVGEAGGKKTIGCPWSDYMYVFRGLEICANTVVQVKFLVPQFLGDHNIAFKLLGFFGLMSKKKAIAKPNDKSTSK